MSSLGGHDAAQHARLQALYAPAGGLLGVFSSKVADYVASRPGYPDALLAVLAQHAGLRPGAAVLDVGAGTGLLTRSLLARGAQVLAVEPNAAMRAACDARLAGTPGYSSAEGTAEALPVQAGSVTLITAAQAFHWFEVPAARAEALRVLAPGGQVALIWNDRVAGDPLNEALDAICNRFGGERRSTLLAHEERGGVAAFFGAATPVLHWRGPHQHGLTEDGLARLLFSRSYMPSDHTPEGAAVRVAVGEVFRQHARHGQALVRYDTVLSLGRPAA